MIVFSIVQRFEFSVNMNYRLMANIIYVLILVYYA